MFIMPKISKAELEKWRKANPALAAQMDQEMARVMSQLTKDSLKKYGKQANGCIRIDSKMFTQALEGK